MISCGASKQNITKACEKPEESDAVFEVKHRHGNSVAHVNKSNMYIIMRKEKAPIYKLSRSKAPNTKNLPYRHARKISGPIFVRHERQL